MEYSKIEVAASRFFSQLQTELQLREENQSKKENDALRKELEDLKKQQNHIIIRSQSN